MADISSILKNKGLKQPKEKNHYEVTMIHYTQIHPSKMQFYSQNDIGEQADAIELAGGIMQPLVVSQQDADQYELLAGHRRLEAVKLLVENRKLNQYSMVPCHIEKANDWQAEYLLITTNGYREKSGYEKMIEVQRLAEIIPHLSGNETLKGRALRGRIAKELKTGETSVQIFNYIYNHLCPEGMEAFRVGEIKTTVAYELAHLQEADQKVLLQTRGVTSADITEYVNKKTCQTLTQKRELENKGPLSHQTSSAKSSTEEKEYKEKGTSESVKTDMKPDSDNYANKSEINYPGSAVDRKREYPTKDEQRKILLEIIEENEKALATMEDYRAEHMPKVFLKHHLMILAAEKYLEVINNTEI